MPIVKRRVEPCDDRPRLRVGGGLTGEVPGLEFLERGVDVVRIEDDGAGQPVVGIDLDDAEHLSGDLTWFGAARRGMNANECNTVLADR